jgi:aryl sulfotransferase
MTMATELPEVLHLYQNHHLDSTRWQHYLPRDGDVIVTTPYKSGTTWMQLIVLNLIFLGREVPTVWDASPWLEQRRRPIEEVMAILEAQSHRRCIKTHLALDGLPFYPQVKYIVVGRDPRDVFMSLWNHYSNHTDAFFERLNSLPGRVGAPFPRPPQNLHELWPTWITRGWFAWESEGYPYWGNMHHIQTWWHVRHLPNILFVHFHDLLTNLQAEIRRVAHFLEVDSSDATVTAVAQAVTFDTVKQNADKLFPQAEQAWQGGAETFFFKGTNGRWRGVLSEHELAMYEETASKVLTQECRAWLEQPASAMADALQGAPIDKRI